jgi:hypothetical protein
VRDQDEIQLRLLPCKLHRHVRGTCYTLTASAATRSTAGLRAYTNTPIILFINPQLSQRPFPLPTVNQHQLPRDPQILQQEPSLHPNWLPPYQHFSASLPKMSVAARLASEVRPRLPRMPPVDAFDFASRSRRPEKSGTKLRSLLLGCSLQWRTSLPRKPGGTSRTLRSPRSSSRAAR